MLLSHPKNNRTSIVFDYGGVLGNNPGEAIYSDMSAFLGISVNRIKSAYLQYFVGLSSGRIDEPVFWSAFAKSLGDINCKLLQKEWIESFDKHCRFNDDIIPILEELQKCCDLYLISNSVPFYRSQRAEKVIIKYFKSSIYSYQAKARKPDREIFDAFFLRNSCTPNNTIFIDDDLSKVVYPKEIGSRIIIYESIIQLKRELALLLDK